VFDLIEKNGISTIEGIDDTIRSIENDETIDAETKTAMITALQQTKKDLITNIGLAL